MARLRVKSAMTRAPAASVTLAEVGPASASRPAAATTCSKPGEGCDDGNNTDGDGCNATCDIEDGFPCNITAPGDTDDDSCESNICDTTGGSPGICEPANSCGNSVLETGEGCDDGNNTPGDGCNATCDIEDGFPCNITAPGDTDDDSCESNICDTTGGSPGICEPANSCGNSVLELNEGCDDGNNTPGDGCNATCDIEDGFPCNITAPGDTDDDSCESNICDTTGGSPGICEPANSCGNSVLELNEGCDDGNNTPGDGCNATCDIEDGFPCNITAPGDTDDDSCESNICDTTGGSPGICEPANSCGNSVLETGEGCDDGNNTPGDGCNATCEIEDGFPCNITAPGDTDDDSCESNICDTSGGSPGICQPDNFCGNSVLETGEGCDDGNNTPGDGCNATCDIEDGFPCNITAPGDTDDDSCESNICDTTGGSPGICEPANTCGNGVLEADEGCDDGNDTPGDGCNASCLIEDGNACNETPPGETGDDSCDSGVCDTSGGAPGVCVPAGCGNNLLEAGEGCDDGNNTDGDGCNAMCLIENGDPCNETPPGETGDDSCDSGFCDVSGGAPGVCEDGDDGDGDGVPDSIDLDDDNDGIPDAEEGGDTEDTDGDGIPNRLDLDTDNDGIPDVIEAGHDSPDGDSDGVIDCAGGFGANGLCDDVETSADSGDTDYDGDGAGPDDPADTDGDGVDDYRDLDTDNDGIPDLIEGDTGCSDSDRDAICDGGDSDGDGIVDDIDEADGFGDDDYDAPPDTDGDGVPDFRDLDADNDAISDVAEGGSGCTDADDNGVCDGPDGDGDGIPDSIDGSTDFGDDDYGDPPNTDGDGDPDYRDLDSDDDTFPDIEEGGNGDRDGNNDGRIDDPTDGDGDGIADGVDSEPGSHGGLGDSDIDDDGDDIPNFRDPDANGDGIRDNFGVSGGACRVGGGASDAGTALLVLLFGMGVMPALRRRRRKSLESPNCRS